ncbi:MAG: carboxylesterase/lipase family protein [Promethearchaeota archaeon]
MKAEIIEKTDIIKTKSGNIRGYCENDLNIFKGIPYAESPIGDLRFEPPIAKKPWDDILEATEYGSCAYQAYTELEDWLGKPEPESEDCLFLNIWTPATDDKKRPVMFWIHGGAFVIGTGNDPWYDGSALVRRGDVVVVTINYRLGFFGFSYISGITANVGLLDQIKALEWVQDNIELFGGDPNNITIFGQSAGGYSVLSLCSIPAAKGLFRRVIAQSAPYIDPSKGESVTKRILRKLKIKGGNLNAARDFPPEQIIDAQNRFFADDPNNILALRPIIDEETYPKHPIKDFRDGNCSDIDFMIGTNLDEAKMFTAMKALRSVTTMGERLAVGYLGMQGIDLETSKKIINKYKEAREGKFSTEPKDIFDAIMTDGTFRIPTIRLLEAQSPHQPNTYNYMFTLPSTGLNGILGVCHALEIPFIFSTLEAPNVKNFVKANSQTKALSEKMMDAWINFARTGNPNHKNIPEWPAYNAETRATMIFGEECKIENAIFDQERKLWDGFLEI